MKHRQLWLQWLHLSLFFFLFFIENVHSFNKFCSVTCQNQSCTTSAFNDCISCRQPWIMNITTNKCQVNSTSGWFLVDTSSDLSGGLISNVSQVTQCGTNTSTSWGYNYIGNLTGRNILKFTGSYGQQGQHFQLRIIFWMILIDNWSIEDMVKVTLDGNQTKQISRNQKQTEQRICGNGGNQQLLRYDTSYFHNQTASFQFQITTTNNNSNWGVKQFFVLARNCDPACTVCFGPYNNQCTACQNITPMYLLGTTCLNPCPVGYSVDSLNNCIQCDSKCIACSVLPTNCSVCTNISYFIAATNSCVAACPSTMYKNTTDMKCYDCISSLGYLMVNGTCIYCPISHCINCIQNLGVPICVTCQTGYMLINTTNICSSCNLIGCLLCSSPSVCSNCTTGYSLINGTCVPCSVTGCSYCQISNFCASCLTGHSLINGTCVLCNVANCSLCQSTNNCSQCVSTHTQQNGSCYQCPLPICTHCPADNYCTACSTGYKLFNGVCYSCTMPACIQCKDNNICNLCDNGFTLVSGLCIRCSIPGCLRCDANGLCTDCQIGYSLTNGTCVQCNIFNCVSCSLANVCSVCKIPAKLFSPNCYLCDIDNCDICSSNNKCKACKADYSLINEQCYRLSSASMQLDKDIAKIIIATCSSILFLACAFGIICFCLRKRRKNEKKNKIQNTYRQETKGDILQFTTSRSNRKLQPLRSSYRENLTLENIYEIEPTEKKEVNQQHKQQSVQQQQSTVKTKTKNKKKRNKHKLKQKPQQPILDQQNNEPKQGKTVELSQQNRADMEIGIEHDNKQAVDEQQKGQQNKQEQQNKHFDDEFQLQLNNLQQLIKQKINGQQI